MNNHHGSWENQWTSSRNCGYLEVCSSLLTRSHIQTKQRLVAVPPTAPEMQIPELGRQHCSLKHHIKLKYTETVLKLDVLFHVRCFPCLFNPQKTGWNIQHPAVKRHVTRVAQSGLVLIVSTQHGEEELHRGVGLAKVAWNDDFLGVVLLLPRSSSCNKKGLERCEK